MFRNEEKGGFSLLFTSGYPGLTEAVVQYCYEPYKPPSKTLIGSANRMLVTQVLPHDVATPEFLLYQKTIDRSFTVSDLEE
jgi:hypothetical protein